MVRSQRIGRNLKTGKVPISPRRVMVSSLRLY
jgi:hypothetical protein